MTYVSERQDIETYFKDVWQDLFPDMVIGFDGEQFTPPTDAVSLELEIVPGEGEQRTFGDPGGNVARYNGVLLVRIRAPGGRGTHTIRTYVDHVIRLMMNKTIGDNIVTRVPYVQTRVADQPFIGWSVAIPFDRDIFTA